VVAVVLTEWGVDTGKKKEMGCGERKMSKKDLGMEENPR
jgi:hypothetical protein